MELEMEMEQKSHALKMMRSKLAAASFEPNARVRLDLCGMENSKMGCSSPRPLVPFLAH